MKLLLLITSLFVVCINANANIYKCVNSEGLTIFKDSPCNKADKIRKIIKPDIEYDKELDVEIIVDNKGPLGKNLLKNSKFENKLLDWKVPLGAFWTGKHGFNQTGGLVIQAKKPPEDRYIHETKVEQCVLLGEGEKFGLYARFRHTIAPDKAHANRASVVWYESTDCTRGGQYGGYIQPKQYVAGWQHLQNNYLKPALGAKAALISIVQRARYAAGAKAVWDNIEFMATQIHNQSGVVNKQERSAQRKRQDEHTLSIGKNYLLNAEFNNDVAAWRPGWKVSWSGIQGDRLPGSARVDAISKTGGIGSGAFSQCVNIGRNVKFILGASFKRDENSSQKGSGRLRLSWYGGNNCTGRGKTDTRSADPKYIKGWQKLLTKKLTAPYKAKSALIEVIQSVAGKGRFTAYWDDLYFKAVK